MRTGNNVKYTHTFDEIIEEFSQLREFRHIPITKTMEGHMYGRSLIVENYCDECGQRFQFACFFYEPKHSAEWIFRHYGICCVVCGIIFYQEDWELAREESKKGSNIWLNHYITEPLSAISFSFDGCSLCFRCSLSLRKYLNRERISYAESREKLTTAVTIWLTKIMEKDLKKIKPTLKLSFKDANF